MKNWKTNLGGAVNIVGKSLMTVGVLGQIADGHSQLLMYIAVTGFVLESLGAGLTALFAADSSQVQQLAAQLNGTTPDAQSPMGTTKTGSTKE